MSKAKTALTQWLMRYALLEGAALIAVIGIWYATDRSITFLVASFVGITAVSGYLLIRRLAVFKEDEARERGDGLDIR